MGGVVKRWLLLVWLSGALWAAPPEGEVWKAVEAAGVPRNMATMRTSETFAEVACIGWQPPDRGLELKAVYMDGRYCTPNQATANIVGKLDEAAAVAWVAQVLLSFESPCLAEPTEFVGLGTFRQPEALSDGRGGFKVRLWVREPGQKTEFSLRQYHLTPQGARLTVQQRWRPRSDPGSSR